VVLLLLSAYLGKNKPDHAVEDGRNSRRLALAEMRRWLGWKPQRLVFEPLVFFAQLYSAARENMKSTFLKAHGRLRDLYLALSDRLVHSGLIANSEDVFYLLHSELESLIAEPQQSRILFLTFPKNSFTPPGAPPLGKGRGSPENARAASEWRHPADIRWPAASIIWTGWQITKQPNAARRSSQRGQVTGRVRVILDPLKGLFLAARRDPGGAIDQSGLVAAAAFGQRSDHRNRRTAFSWCNCSP
jgi:hypothetical protein